MAKKRVFLDECVSDLGHVFGAKAHVYTAHDLGVAGQEDIRVIEKAFELKCLIVTVNKDFLDYYYNHPHRKGRRGVYFYGLIFLKPSKQLTREKQLRLALKTVEWEETRQHDDLVRVSATGKTRHERLCHPECAAEFPKNRRNGIRLTHRAAEGGDPEPGPPGSGLLAVIQRRLVAPDAVARSRI